MKRSASDVLQADGPQWVYEIKLDGYRAIAVKADGHRDLLSRRRKSFVRAPDIEAKLKGVKAILLSEAHSWAESINYAVTHETDGKLASELLKAFGVTPSTAEKPEPEKEPRLGTLRSADAG